MYSRILSVTLCVSLVCPVGAWAQARQQTAVQQTAAVSASVPAGQPLSEEEEVELAQRAEEPGEEVAGGALSNLHLTYAVIALAAIVLVLVVK